MRAYFIWREMLTIASVCSALCLSSFLLNAATSTIIYSYDALNRVTNATYAGGAQEQFTLDPAGNRLQSITRAATIPLDTIAPSTPGLFAGTDGISTIYLGWSPSTDIGGSGLAGLYPLPPQRHSLCDCSDPTGNHEYIFGHGDDPTGLDRYTVSNFECFAYSICVVTSY